MALLDISDITRALVTLIKQSLNVSPVWTAALPDVLPEPPNRIKSDGLGVYLYHMQEKKEYSNFPTQSGDQPAVRYLPTALTLYYQVSANSIITDGTGAYLEQLLMSVAIKALHDYPLIDDTTKVNGVTLFPLELRGKQNRFKITHQPIPYTEAVHNWTAGDSSIRLSAYYELETVFLEPEETTSYTGRVLSYGNYIFTTGAPQIISSQSVVQYIIPGDPTPRQVKVQPAQSARNNTIDFMGSGFNTGEISLRLIHPRYTQPVIASNAWNLTLTALNQLTVTVQSAAQLESTGVPIDVLPGIYSAQVVITRKMPSPDGGIREISNSSNQFPFIVAPDITIGNIGAGVVTVNGFIFRHASLSNDDVEVYLGEEKLTRDTAATPGPKKFRVINPNQLKLGLPAGVVSGQLIPLRVIIGGAESLPTWIKVP